MGLIGNTKLGSIVQYCRAQFLNRICQMTPLHLGLDRYNTSVISIRVTYMEKGFLLSLHPPHPPTRPLELLNTAVLSGKFTFIIERVPYNYFYSVHLTASWPLALLTKNVILSRVHFFRGASWSRLLKLIKLVMCPPQTSWGLLGGGEGKSRWLSTDSPQIPWLLTQLENLTQYCRGFLLFWSFQISKYQTAAVFGWGKACFYQSEMRRHNATMLLKSLERVPWCKLVMCCMLGGGLS